MSRLERVKQSLRAIELLKEQKKTRTYESISKEINLPITVLNRYVKGRVLPNGEKTKRIISLYEKSLRDDAKSRVLKFKEFINDIDLLADVELLDAIAKTVSSEFSDINLIITTEDGLPFATLLAREIGAKIGYLRDRKKLGVEGYIEINIFNEKGVARPLYLPKDLCSKRTRAIFVDDLIRTGSSAEAILRVISNHCRLEGCLTLIAIGNAGKKRIGKLCPVKTFVEFKQNG